MRGFVISILVLSFVVNICGGVDFDAVEVTRMLEKSLKCHRNPGMAVAVVKDGKILYSNGFGVADRETGTKVTDDTVFNIASLSKSFAAALLVKLLDENTELTLNSKVRELLKDDFVMPDEVRTKETTFVDLLAHKTAMLSNNRIRLDTNFTRQTLLSRLRLLPSNRQFRVDFIYNNMIYGLVSRISEIIGGKDYEDLISEHFFQPLGMTKSTFATRVDYCRADLAHGYIQPDKAGKYEKVSSELSRRWADMIGSGGVMSTAKEMAKWMMFHLSRGKDGQGKEVMDSGLVYQLHKPRFLASSMKYLDIEVPEFPVTSHWTQYALGLRVGHYRGYDTVGHTGSTFGFATLMTMLPSENIGVITLMNGDDLYYKHRAAVQFYLMDRALGLDPWLDDSTMCTFPKPFKRLASYPKYRPQMKDGNKLKYPLAQYRGTYSDEAFGNMDITYDKKRKCLVGSYGWGDWVIYLWPRSKTYKTQRFYGKGIEPYFAPDMKPFYFITHPVLNDTIIGIKAYAFESKRPPILCKAEYKQVCEEEKARLYPKDDPYKCDKDSQ